MANEVIGKVPCPHRGCELEADVRKFATRTDDQKRQRFGGKMYCKCGAGHRSEDQEYILENAEIWGSEKGSAAPAVAAVKPPAVPAVKPAEKSAPALEPAKSNGWRPLLG